MAVIYNDRRLKSKRRALRSALTPAEVALWRILQRSQLDGRKFRRQHSIGRYIVDFYCPRERLVVDLEGAAHDSDRVFLRDDERERFLRSLGLKVLRFENCLVLDNPDDVVSLIRRQFTAGSG